MDARQDGGSGSFAKSRDENPSSPLSRPTNSVSSSLPATSPSEDSHDSSQSKNEGSSRASKMSSQDPSHRHPKGLKTASMDVDDSLAPEGCGQPCWLFLLCLPCNVFQFAWLCPFICRGLRHTPTMQSLPRMLKTDRISLLAPRFLSYYNGRRRSSHPSSCCLLFLTLIWMSLGPIVLASLFQLVSSVGTVAIPRLMEGLLRGLRVAGVSVAERERLRWYGLILPEGLRPTAADQLMSVGEVWGWLGALVATHYFNMICTNLSFYIGMIVGLRWSGILVGALFHKSLRLSSKARTRYPSGKILSLAQTDTQKILMAFRTIFVGFTAIPTIAVSIYFMVDLMGISAGISASVYVVSIPLILICWGLMTRLRTSAARSGDVRVGRLTELLQGIRVTKFFGWEGAYVKRIGEARKKEVGKYHGVASLYAIVFSFMHGSNYLGQMIACALLWFFSESFDPVVLFTAVAYFGLLYLPLLLLPIAVVGIIDVVISLRRIHAFLQEEEVEELMIEDQKCAEQGLSVRLENASFEWERTDNVGGGEKEKKDHPSSSSSSQKQRETEIEMVEKNEDDEKMQIDPTTIIMPWRLNDISLEIERGSCVFVIGRVGSGKSSLLSALLGDMKQVSGSFGVHGNIAYCSQLPWIQNGTMKDNITFGRELDEALLDEVIRVSCLTSDIEILQGGVDISIGERGINLSGGQKYRVSLARACYWSPVCDIYLLDDPLGAVDAHVGREILESCICGFLKDKTRIVVSHQLQHLDHSDYVILMDEGCVVEAGPYEELMMLENGLVRSLVSEYEVSEEEEEEEEGGEEEEIMEEEGEEREDEGIGAQGEDSEIVEGDDLIVAKPEVGKKKPTTSRDEKTITLASDITDEVEGEREEENEPESNEETKPTKIIKEEEIAEGCVACNVVLSYVRATGCHGFPCFLMIVAGVLAELLVTLNAWWLGEWSSGTFSQTYGSVFNASYYQAVDSNLTQIGLPVSLENNGSCPVAYPQLCFSEQVDITWQYYSNGTLLRSGLDMVQSAGVYAALGIVSVIGILIRDLLILHCSVGASNRLHNRALRTVARAPMSWFDTTPLGRVIARMTTDVFLADWMLPLFLTILASCGFGVIFALLLIGIVTKGIFVAVLVPVAIVFFVVYLVFRKVSVEWKRLGNVSRSPVVAQFSESLIGRSTIRSYSREEAFFEVNLRNVDLMTRAAHVSFAGRSWIAVTLGAVSSIMLFILGVVCIASSFYFPESLKLALPFLSLAVAKMLTASNRFSKVIEFAAQTEALMSSVERLDHFARNLITEDDVHQKMLVERGRESVVPPSAWPSEGRITFADFAMRYRPGLPLVLKSVSFEIRPAEKVGVVGRTGSGKSSLMLALYRMVEGCLGSIIIDDIDHACVSIETLRSKLSMIPQDPVLFEGTVRTNLDPFQLASDAQIWSALEKSYMQKKIQKLGGLDQIVAESGSNFSLGEKQLLCLARALLRQTKILLLDEVTASVDLRTDMKIQRTVRLAFSHCTVITIAHRLRTIIDSDRIMVLENGKVVEFDTPKNLLLPLPFSEEKTTENEDDESPPVVGVFAKLVEEDGPESAALLRDVAFGRREMAFGDYESGSDEETTEEEEEEKEEKEGNLLEEEEEIIEEITYVYVLEEEGDEEALDRILHEEEDGDYYFDDLPPTGL